VRDRNPTTKVQRKIKKLKVFDPTAMNKTNHLQQLKNGTGRGKPRTWLDSGKSCTEELNRAERRGKTKTA
jgi:hypothetical protein